MLCHLLNLKMKFQFTEAIGDSLNLYSLSGSSFTDTISIPLLLSSPIALLSKSQYFIAGNSKSSQVGLYNSYETKKPTLEKLPDVELLSFEIDSVKFKYDNFLNRNTSFTFQPRLTIRNNGKDTLKSFMIFRLSGYGVNCYLEAYTKEIKSLNITS